MLSFLTVLLGLLNRKTYLEHFKYIDLQHLKENYPETYRLYLCLQHLHENSEAQSYSIQDLEVTLLTLYPNSDHSSYSRIFNQLREINFDPTALHGFLRSTQERAIATELAKDALSVAEGRHPLSWFIEHATLKTQGLALPTPQQEDNLFEEDDLQKIREQDQSLPGLRWPLDSLNRTIGSLRLGDFGFIFARPETGKTTFLCHAVTHMANQGEGSIVWFNNEERGSKVVKRLYQAALGLRLPEIYSNLPTNVEKYYEKTNRNIKLVRDQNISKKQVEDMCAIIKPKLIIFDQIDKIKGFNKDQRQDLELKDIYSWAREIARTYGPTIGVCQAGGTGEGKKWLTMNDVDSSKTAKQGEADFILGIGKSLDEDLQNVRYLHLSKNKQEGDDDLDESMRHGKWEVKIKPEIAQYADF
jgi:hypothetical protein